MPKMITCPCGKRLRVPDGHQGETAQCPACGRTLRLTQRDEPLPLQVEQPTDFLDKVVGSCQACAKPITLRQRERFGYYCSDECLRRGIALFQPAVPEGAETAQKEAGRAVKRTLLLSALFLAAVGIGLLAYLLFGPRVRVRWTHKTDSQVSDITASRRLLCFLGTDGTLHALNCRSGRPLWQRPMPSGHLGLESVLPVGNSCILASGTMVQALDWKTGNARWESELSEGATSFSSNIDEEKGEGSFTVRFEWGDRLVIPLAAPDQDTVIVLEGGTDAASARGRYLGFLTSRPASSTKKLVALDLETGRPRWEKELGEVDFLKCLHTENMLTFAIREKADTPVYSLFALDATSGQQLAKIPLTEPSDQSQSEPSTSRSTPADNFAAMARDLFSAQPFQTDIIGRAATICAADGRLYIPSGEFLACLSLREETQLWSSYAGKVTSGPFYSSGRVFVAVPAEVVKALPAEEDSVQAHIRKLLGLDYEEPYFILKCFDADTGKKIWQTEIETPRFACSDRALVTLLAIMRPPASTNPANQEYVL